MCYLLLVVGYGESLVCLKVLDWFDFEGEFVIIIGKFGRNILVVNVFDYVVGYICFNDGFICDF